MLNVIDPQQPTAVITLRVVAALRQLLPLRLAGIVSGLPRGRAEQWFRRGKAGNPGFTPFYCEVARTIADLKAVEDELAGVFEIICPRAHVGDQAAVRWLTEFHTLPRIVEQIESNLAKNRRAAGRRPRRG